MTSTVSNKKEFTPPTGMFQTSSGKFVYDAKKKGHTSKQVSESNKKR